MDSRDPKSGEPLRGGRGDAPTIENLKPPREWRSVRSDPGRAVVPPRVVASVHALESEPAAGSRSPADAPLEAAPATSRPPESKPTPTLSADPLPHTYGQDRLVLLVRDPWWVYTWWELTPTALERGRAAVAEAADLTLRVYDISAIHWDGHNHHSYFDIDIDIGDLAGNWYIELGKPGASYCAELGLRTADGRFLALVRSNVVTLPRAGMSEVVDEEWMIVEEDFRRLFDLAGGGSIGIGSGDIQRLLEQRLRSELASGGVSSFGLSSPAVRRS